MTPMKSQITFRQVALIMLAGVVSVAVANYDKLLPHRWQTYTAPDGSFSVELLGKPTVETTPVPVEGGSTTPMTMVTVNPTNSTAYSLDKLRCMDIDFEHVPRLRYWVRRVFWHNPVQERKPRAVRAQESLRSLEPVPGRKHLVRRDRKRGTAKADAPVIDLDETDLDLPF
jgi:hypothetical protein